METYSDGLIPSEAKSKINKENQKETREQQGISVELPLLGREGDPHIMSIVGHGNPGEVGLDQFGNVTINVRNITNEDGSEETEYLAIQLPEWVKKAVAERKPS